jgi:transposase
VRAHIKEARGATANIPDRIWRKKRFRWTKALYRQRNHVEHFFNKLKQFRRITSHTTSSGELPGFRQFAAARASQTPVAMKWCN